MLPTLPTQTLVPGVVDPSAIYGGTRRIGGSKVIEADTAAPKPGFKPLPNLGEERHSEVLSAIKGLKVSIKQTAEQNVATTDAFRETRPWRG